MRMLRAFGRLSFSGDAAQKSMGLLDGLSRVMLEAGGRTGCLAVAEMVGGEENGMDSPHCQ